MSSFSDKLKEAQRQSASIATTASYGIMTADEPAIMTLDMPGIAANDVAAFAIEEWVKPANAEMYDYYTEYYDDNVSTVDENKNIVFHPNQTTNLTQEKNSQYIPVIMDRYSDGFDLSTTNLSFYWVNEAGAGGTAFPVDVYYNSEKIKFALLVDEDMTSLKGHIELEIHAEGTNSLGRGYLWKTKSNKELNVLQALEIQSFIEPDETWQTSFIERISDQANRAEVAATKAESAATTAQNLVTELQNGLEDEVQKVVSGNYYTKTETEDYVAQEIKKADISDKLADYALRSELPVVPTNVSAFTNDAGYLTEHQSLDGYAKEEFVTDKIGNIGEKTVVEYVNDQIADADISEKLNDYVTTEALNSKLGNLVDGVGIPVTVEQYVKQEVEAVDVSEQLGDTGLNDDGSKKTVVQYVDEAVASVDVSGQLENYYTKDETYNRDEIDEAIGNVEVDLTGYATEEFVGQQISPVNTAITNINQTLEGIDKSPRVTYRATYGDVELDDGSTAEYMFTLWKNEGDGDEVQDRFQILGGGGGAGSSIAMRIVYIEGYGTPLVATVDDKVILKYDFSGEDSAGDTNLDGTASWKVGSRVVKTEDVSTGINEFDLTDYVSVGDNKVVLTITHATGAMATKAWTIKIIDVRLVESFDDTRKYTANSPVNYTFIPYGGIEKTVHFILDGEEIGTKTSLAASSGLSDSYDIPAHEHGTHLLEVYMNAEVNGKTIESNRLFSDIIWYDETSLIPVISCTQQEFTARQYETTNIEYTVYDPSTETPVVTRKATYVNEEGEIVETYNSTSTLQSNTDIWSFKTDVIGEHTLTISCGETVKTLKATITEIGIEVSPTTAGLEFDFNPVGRSNNDENRIWTDNNTGVSMTVSDNFDWVNGGYQIDENGDQYFCVKAGTTATINYNLFADDAKANGKEFKVIFKTTNVKNRSTSFISCMDYGIGLDMKVESANIYSSNGSLYSPYCEDDIIEFEFNINKNTEIPMVMTYEDGVGNRPMIYTSDSSFWQTNPTPIVIGSNNCDVYIYRMKAYSTSLSDRDILNNFIADARNAEEMIARYERNQIYKDGLLNPEYLAEVCPDLRIILLDAPWFTNDKDNKVTDTNITMIYKNGDPILDNWTCTGATHRGRTTCPLHMETYVYGARKKTGMLKCKSEWKARFKSLVTCNAYEVKLFIQIYNLRTSSRYLNALCAW